MSPKIKKKEKKNFEKIGGLSDPKGPIGSAPAWTQKETTSSS